MILPLASAYYLFASTMNVHNDEKVEEYYKVYEKIQKIEPSLQLTELYDPLTKKTQLDHLTDDQIAITLYNEDGYILYNSQGSTKQIVTKTETLYKNMYDIQSSLRAYTYKAPVFDEGNMVGIYEIKIARDEFAETITTRGIWVTTIFILSFIVIFAGVAIIIQNRVNKPISRLMDEMSAFASGKTYPETKTGNDEVGELKRHFYEMRTQITEAQEAVKKEQKDKEYMVAAISHDLKTPLTSIKAYAEALESPEHLTKEEREQYRHVIIDKSDFMKQMLDDLLTHTLLLSKGYELNVVTVDGEEFFDMIISDYDALAGEKNITLTTENTVIGEYDVSPNEMMRVVDNLMINAIQHTPEDGYIWMSTFSEKTAIPTWLFDYVQENYEFDTEKNMYLIVQNEGKGIKASAQTALFDPLYQVDQARSKKDAHGTGLGLSISQIIIEKHGGIIDVRSQINEGACFICTLPKQRKE